MTDPRIVLTTCADAPAAETLARTLVGERLAACVNLVHHVHSVYRWRSAVEESDEILLVIKTTAGAVPELTKRIRELSSYEVPEVVVLDVAGGSPAYLEWIAGSVAVPTPRG